uniref:CSON005864 protein n=1 Tax=Culicoides sonorensis TaxID=179676 RepID=A0A336L9F7_CULSO
MKNNSTNILISIIFYFFFLTCAIKANFLSDRVLPSKWKSVKDCQVRYFDTASDISWLSHGFGNNHDEPNEFQHIAEIGFSANDTKEIQWDCVGTLISENYVLISGDCASLDGTQPEVVRLGEANQKEYFWISEIIPHPDLNLINGSDTIAILKLNETVSISSSICPACLWKNDEMNFKQIEVLNSKFIKMSVNVTDCPDPNDEKICIFEDQEISSDSSAIFHIKLLGNQKLNPFIVGIGQSLTCDGENPSFITKISSCINWIESVTHIETDPRKCASKFEHYRERANSISARLDDFPHSNSYLVRIGWTQDYAFKLECNGVILTEKFVLTPASCLELYDGHPNTIQTGDDQFSKSKMLKFIRYLIKLSIKMILL